MVAEIRQKALPATTNALPTNLYNQDIVPMSLAGGLRTAEQLELTGVVIGSLAVALAQTLHLSDWSPTDPVAKKLMNCSPRLTHDRPLSEEVRNARDVLVRAADERLGRDASIAGQVAVG
jgi:histidine ammonia-lyase